MTTDAEVPPRNGGSRPVPDPTVLTDAAIAKAVEAITDHVAGKFDLLSERLNGIDTATTLRLRSIEDIPNQIDRAVTNLERLHDERFRSVAQQFVERDTRSEREARDNKVAVDAAFAAQKEAAAKQDEGNQKAIDKSEKTTTETIAKLGDLVDTNIHALSDKIDDLKDRLTEVAKITNGSGEHRLGSRESYSDLKGLAVVVFGALSAALAIYAIVKP
jgi:hypothetical protein